MSDVERLIQRVQGGAPGRVENADPRPFLSRVSGEPTAPRSPGSSMPTSNERRGARFDATAFRSSREPRRGGGGPPALARRHGRAVAVGAAAASDAGTASPRAELVAELAARLGAQSRQDKVAGLLPRDGAGPAARRRACRTPCSTRSARSLGVAGESLRKAGDPLARGRGPLRMDEAAVIHAHEPAPQRRSGTPRSTGSSAAAERVGAARRSPPWRLRAHRHAAGDRPAVRATGATSVLARAQADRALEAAAARALRSGVPRGSRPRDDRALDGAMKRDRGASRAGAGSECPTGSGTATRCRCPSSTSPTPASACTCATSATCRRRRACPRSARGSR